MSFKGASDGFAPNGSGFTPTEGNGSSLTQSGNTYTYTSRDGTVIAFQANYGSAPFYDADTARATSVVFADGGRIDYGYKIVYFCLGGIESGVCTGGYQYGLRLQSITNGSGYQLKMAYASNAAIRDNDPAADYDSWQRLVSVTAINNAVDYCSPTADSCSLTNSWPTATFSRTTDPSGAEQLTVTDAASQATRYSTDTYGRMTGVKRPGASSDTVTIAYGSNGVSSVARDGVTHSYGYSASGSTLTTTVTDPNGGHRVYISDTGTERVGSYQDELGRTTSYTYDTNGRLTRITAPEGNYVQYTYDARGNVTEARSVAKAGSGVSDLVASAAFASSCASAVTCNKPASTTDARGNTTDYSYDSTHGGLLTATLPAPTSGATRPQTRYGYTALQAYVKNSAGSIVATGQSVYMLTSVSQCQTGSSCAGTSDEVKTTTVYGSTGVANNLLPTSVTSGSGDGALTATTALTYDNIGNVLTVDGPLPGTADTTRYRWDSVRRLVGSASADPDGAGSLKPRAVRTTYNSDGQATKVERGTVNSQSDGDWAAFASLQEVDTGYDANGRPVTQSLISGGTTYALTQASYDALGRVQCSAQRMNPATYSSLPSDACTLGTAGSFGSDRIVKTTYDAAGEVTKTTSGYGTSEASDDASSTYSSNGKVQTVTDAEGNKTSYVYDGQDRLSQTLYPSTTKGAGASNSSDYEQLGYDANSNVTSFRNRAGETMAFTFDALNRMTYKDLPGTEPDVTYAYDLTGHMTSAATSSQTHSFTYDALGRNLTQTGPQGTLTSTYDLGGRRTRLTHPDGFYVDQDYLVTGELQAIRENGATSGVGVLATYAYDDLGRRTSLTRGDGSSTSYTFDAVSRPTQLSEDLAGTSYDQTLGFGYNPAGQITSNTRSNDIYAWTGHYNVNRGYTANGLNQYTASGSVTPTYDTKGNLTSAGGTTYTYSSENLLRSASGGVTLSYDPAMRLYQTAGGTPGTARFAYDGSNLIAEYNSSNSLQRRYVHGSGTDEPLVWYEGSGTSDRRFLHTDERGSVVAVGSSAGTSVNSYDEYGIPRSSNSGRFQYTGQAWLPELGLYYYKARIYSPTLGRFLQTDPIRFDGGMNIYAAMGADPVNRTDPSGLQAPQGLDDRLKVHPVDAIPVSDIVITGKRCHGAWFGDTCVDLANWLLGSARGMSGDPIGSGIGAGVQAASPAQGPKNDKPKATKPKSPSLSCGNIVDLVAGAVLLTGAKTGLGAIPEGVEAAEFLKIFGIVSKFKIALASTGVAAAGLIGGSIAYYYLRPQIINAICGK